MTKKNKKRALSFFAFFALGSLSFLSGCDAGAEITGIHMTNPETISVYYGNFSYEGIGVTVDFRNGSTKDIALTEDMISEVEKLKFFQVGDQKVEVVFRSKYATTMPINVVLNQFKDTYALNGYECTYDGLPHTVTINQELPEGATLSFPYGNTFTNAGVYEITGVMSKNGYESKTLKTTLTIHQAHREASDIQFDDTTLVYDGEMKTIEAQNVPEEIEVTYDTYDIEHDIRINKVVNAGKYRIVAHFNDSSANYVKIADREAILTIEKAHYDTSAISFEDVTKTYDGMNYEPKLTGEERLPNGVTVSYSCLDAEGKKVESNVGVGTYRMVATFTGGALDNYYPIEPMEARLTVEPRVIKIKDRVKFEGKTVNFEENKTQSLAIEGNLPDTVKVSYENNDQLYAGEYEVTAHFSAVNENEAVDVEQLSAYLIINRVRRSVMVYNDQTKEYDKEFSGDNIVIKDGVASVTGIDEAVFYVDKISFFNMNNTKVEIADMEMGYTYKYGVRFRYVDEMTNDSVILSEESDSFIYQGE